MKNLFKYMLCAGLLCFGLASCTEDEVVVPSDITDLKAETSPGEIMLTWKTPEDETIRYIKVTYYDKLEKKEVMRTASIYADTMKIPETRAKYGTYVFKVQSVSHTDTGGAWQTIEQTSAPAPVRESSAQIQLTGADMSTNAQEPSEGPIAGVVDGNTSTFFHSAWSVDIPAPHWLQANLKKSLTGNYKISLTQRNGNNRPSDFDLMGSTDGKEWFLIRNFTKDGDNLLAAATYNSPVYKVEKPFSQVRMVVNKTNTASVFFSLAEFKIHEVTQVDPEAPDEDVE